MKKKSSSYYVEVIKTPEIQSYEFYEIKISKTNTTKELASYVACAGETPAFTED
jgi:hypothetical protein